MVSWECADELSLMHNSIRFTYEYAGFPEHSAPLIEFAQHLHQDIAVEELVFYQLHALEKLISKCRMFRQQFSQCEKYLLQTRLILKRLLYYVFYIANRTKYNPTVPNSIAVFQTANGLAGINLHFRDGSIRVFCL